jgi:arylformamidase
METDASWIDVTVPIQPGMVCWPGDPPVSVERIEDLEKGDETTFSRLTLGLHAGTHVDAPAHYLRDGAAIETMPPGAMIGPARVIAIRDPQVITPEELAEYDIGGGDRILFRTRNSLRPRERGFSGDFVYLSNLAARYLANRKVALAGIDALSVGGYRKNETAVHRTLLEAGVWIVENLDLSRIAAGEYQLLCLPLKIPGAEAAPARVLLSPQRPGV